VAGDNIGSVALEIQAALDAASWNAAQAAAQSQGRIIGTQLAKAIQDTVNATPIQIRPQLAGVNLDQFRQQAITPPSVPPPIPPAYFQQLQAAQSSAAGLSGELSKVAPAAANASTGLNGMASAANLLQTAFKAFLALQLVNSIRAVGDESQRSKIQIETLAAAYGEVEEAAASVNRVAAVLGISTLRARQEFAQLFAELRPTGAGIREIEVLLVGLNKALQLSGAQAAEAEGALLQIKQALGLGTLQGQELAAVLKSVPVLAKAIAEELGVNVAELRKLGSEGKITGDIIFEATKKLASEAAPAQTAIANIGVAFTNLRERVAEAIGPAVVDVVSKLSATVTVLARSIENGSGAITSFAAGFVEIAKVIGPIVIGVKLYTTAIQALAAAKLGAAKAQAVLLALTGPGGWKILAGAAAAVTAAFVGIDKVSESVSAGIGEIGQEIESLQKQFEEGLADAFWKNAEDGALATSAATEQAEKKVADLNTRIAQAAAERQKIIAASQQEGQLAAEVNAIYNDRTKSFEEQQAAVEAVTSALEKQTQFADKLARLDEVRAQLQERQAQEAQARLEQLRQQASQPTDIEIAFANAGDGSSLKQLERDLEGSYARIAADFNRGLAQLGSDARVDPRFDTNEQITRGELLKRIAEQRRAAQNAGEVVDAAGNSAAAAVAGAGQAAAQSVDAVGGAAGAAIDDSATKALAAALQFAELQRTESQLVAEIKALQNEIATGLSRTIAQAASGLARGDVLSLDGSAIDRASRSIADAFEIGTARVVEVFDFAQSLITQAGGSVTTVGQALIDQLGREGVALVDGFNRSFEAAKEAAANLAQAADRLQGSRAGLERAGLLSATAQQQGIERALSQIRQTGFGNPDINQQALAQAIRDGLRSDNPLAALSSLADQLRANFGARQDVDSAAKTFKDATERAAASQDNLAAAINQLIPQIAVSVSVPVGSSVTSNAEVRYN
jgi:tape measure domain-containing protein